MATVEQQDTDLITIEVDGRSIEARKGEMVIQATDRAGIEIPRFCYHPKLSIAANCRMCLVDIEKAPKPLPACATPVAPGMKVYTRSRRARDAQRGVMEFLLINHPLDCPICDQGGECELQDVSMGYGRGVSRFVERKRVVKDKNLGPLISTDMTRCIHCTRCVRFLEEIAGTCELGGMGRGEHTEISSFIERNIESELSGNVIDVCPVGALTNKPFRFRARAWEMIARASVAMHDCVGSNLYYHVRGDQVMRAVPRSNENINECWLADRDRYSHFGLAASDRLTRPRIRIDGTWQECDWSTALNRAVGVLRGVIDQHGADQFGVLASPRATVEEHLLLARIAEGLGTPHRDHRLRVADDRDPRLGRARLDRPSGELSRADAVFLVGSYLRHEQPILNHRVRTAWRTRGASIMDLNAVAWRFPLDMDARIIVPPQHLVAALARVVRAAQSESGKSLNDPALADLLGQVEIDESSRAVARRLIDAGDGFIVLGDQALQHPDASLLVALAEALASLTEVALMVLPGAANSEGAWRAGLVPADGGLGANAQWRAGLKGWLLYGIEPSMDSADPAAAMDALRNAGGVVAITSFAGNDLLEVADVLLPAAEMAENEGSHINLDGVRQHFTPAVRPPGEARPGWKILRVLGEQLGLDGFDFVSLEQVGDLPQPADTASAWERRAPTLQSEPDRLWRIGTVPIYSGDPLLRRSAPLQQTDHARLDALWIHPADAGSLGLSDGQTARVQQGRHRATVRVVVDADVAPGGVWLPAASEVASGLGPAWGAIDVEPA